MKSSELSQIPLNVLHNFHWIVPGVAARSAQHYVGRLRPFLKARGIRSVINLRGPHPYWRWWRNETEACRALGIAHFDTALCSRDLPSKELLLSLIDAFDAAPKPLLLKCSGGADRTSFAAALFVLHNNGWNALPQADAQFARLPYLHFPKASQRWARRFISYAAAQAGGRPLSDWIRHGYDRREFGWHLTTLL